MLGGGGLPACLQVSSHLSRLHRLHVPADWLTLCSPSCMQVSFAPFKATLTGDAGGQLSQKYLVSSSSGGVQPSPFDVENALWFSWTQPNAFDSQEDAATAFHTFLQGVSLGGRHDAQLLPQSVRIES